VRDWFSGQKLYSAKRIYRVNLGYAANRPILHFFHFVGYVSRTITVGLIFNFFAIGLFANLIAKRFTGFLSGIYLNPTVTGP